MSANPAIRFKDNGNGEAIENFIISMTSLRLLSANILFKTVHNSGSLSIALLLKFVAFSSSVLSEQGGVSLNFVHEWPVIFILSNAFITVLLSDEPAVDIFPSLRKILTILNLNHIHTAN